MEYSKLLHVRQPANGCELRVHTTAYRGSSAVRPTNFPINPLRNPQSIEILDDALTRRTVCREARDVFTPNPDRPYFDAWLRRTGRQLAVSGRLTQVAVVLAAEHGGTPETWSKRLRTVLEGNEVPSLDLLTRIDSLLAGPSACRSTADRNQGQLF